VTYEELLIRLRLKAVLWAWVLANCMMLAGWVCIGRQVGLWP
jgi:hypothetical protein